MVRLNIEMILEGLLKAARKRRRDEERENLQDSSDNSGREVVEVPAQAEHSYGQLTEGVIYWVYEKITDLALRVLEELFAFVEAAILKIVGVAKNAVECFMRDFKVQCAALDAFVVFLTSRLGFQLEM
ncbi:uncharacterized protein LOC27208948 [Drosophila simulans]|uniref:uncharacterized protein LOC27208948 n=1 Tax=Drosophila simulans TaxID=7240 RepID=UPI00078AEE94|nr:uncharacterized protein LOC27208948 [Drosophila simulans]KMZ04926.1 uncharacterized protein Dsimw501_GD29105 [Drosophila simulans]